MRSTLNPVYHDLMRAPTVKSDHCVVCGATGHLEQHHIVWRSWGNLIEHGRKLEKPTVTLCGFGNTGGCHGLAHAHRLHFRWVDREFMADTRDRIADNSVMLNGATGGHLEYLLTDETDYIKALELDGWQRIH